MSVELDPVELGFRRPFTQEVSETLRLRNPNKDPVAFKVKTTAPKHYCVRPNSGRIESGGEVEVQVLLQAMKEDPPADVKCRDKFLVQSVAVSADQELSNVAAIWSNIEQTAKSSIQEKKIRVNFLAPGGATNLASASSTPVKRENHVEDEPPAYTSPVSAQSTPLTTGPVSKMESRPSGSKDISEIVDSAHNPATERSTVIPGPANLASIIPTSGDEVKQQLADAQASIARLTKQIQDQGLRQRKVATDSKDVSSSGSTSVAMQQAPGGVSVPITALLCLLSFLLAYLLF